MLFLATDTNRLVVAGLSQGKFTVDGESKLHRSARVRRAEFCGCGDQESGVRNRSCDDASASVLLKKPYEFIDQLWMCVQLAYRRTVRRGGNEPVKVLKPVC